jgi:dolichyl-phosphate beta-glucosyltransferase
MPGLTIVIPTFEEERKIARDVQEAAAFLISHGFDGEIIVADDGSSDGTVQAAREAPVPPGVQRSVIPAPGHRGKGAAVRSGILASRGEYVMFADSGLTVPFDNALRGLRLLQDGTCDVAHGSRELPESVILRDRDPDRKVISSLFRRLAIFWLHIPPSLTDTQCGFKLYRGDVARRLYAVCETEGFMFDIEIILRALKDGLTIQEFPLEWSCDRDSRLGVRRNAREIVKDFIRLKRMAVRRQPLPRH